MLVVGALLTFALSVLLTFTLSKPGALLYVPDEPNERSLHEIAVPKTGGVALCIAFGFGVCFTGLVYPLPHDFIWVGVAFVLIAVVSFENDRRAMTPLARLVVHFIAAGLLVHAGLSLQRLTLPGAVWDWSPFIGTAFSVVFVVWWINLYNFMDGIDGFAGGMTVFGFGTCAVLGVLAEAPAFAALSLMGASAAAGFLLFNFPPARLFMGDVGASSLGLLAAVTILWADRAGLFSAWIGVLVFSPFVVDATVTLVRRAWKREKVWLPHKSHYYQRLVQVGWGHRKTVLLEYLLMAAAAASAVWASTETVSVQGGVIAAWIFVYGALFAGVHVLERRARR